MTLNNAQLQTFNNLKKFLGTKGTSEADRTLIKLKQSLGGSFKNRTILIAYGGGKDSSYMVAFVRYLQLKILECENINDTFTMRIVVNRQSHMPDTVMKNINRVFKALCVYDDKNIEILFVDDNKVTPVNSEDNLTKFSIPKEVFERDRKDMLMAGHLTNAEGRRVYCDICNAYMQKAEAHAIKFGKNVDIIITGDSLKELVYYKKWIDNLYKLTSSQNIQESPKGVKQGFIIYMDKISAIGKKYFDYIHGNTKKKKYDMPYLVSDSQKPALFTIYNYTSYNVGSHRKMLEEFLGFKFDADSLAFSFTESDCAMPALMAHLRGLKVEKLYGRTYEEGVKEYANQLAIPLMKAKQFPGDLILEQKELYSSSEKINTMKNKVSEYYKVNLNLNDENLTAMVYSPFASHGKNLKIYLEKEKPELSIHLKRLHAILSGISRKNISDKQIIKILEKSIGLNLQDMQHIYKKELFIPKTIPSKNLLEKGENIMAKIVQYDPHKKFIKTKHSPDSPYIKEEISGR